MSSRCQWCKNCIEQKRWHLTRRKVSKWCLPAHMSTINSSAKVARRIFLAFSHPHRGLNPGQNSLHLFHKNGVRYCAASCRVLHKSITNTSIQPHDIWKTAPCHLSTRYKGVFECTGELIFSFCFIHRFPLVNTYSLSLGPQSGSWLAGKATEQQEDWRWKSKLNEENMVLVPWHKIKTWGHSWNFAPF